MLDDQEDSLKDRLKAYREEPDENLWNRISSELPGNSIKDQLSNYEEEPDALVWSSIQNKIGAGTQANWFARVSYGVTALTLVGIALLHYPINGPGEVDDKIVNKRVEELHSPSSDSVKKLIDTKSKDSLNISRADKTLSVPETSLAKKQEAKQSVTTDSRVNATAIQPKKKGVGQTGINSTRFISSIDSSSRNTNLKTALRSPVDVDSLKQDSLHLEEKNQIVKNDSVMDKPAKKEKKSSPGSGIYFLVMPTFGYQQLAPSKDDNIIVESLQKISAFSTSRLGIRAEIGWEKTISKRLVLNVGLLYFQRKQTISYNYLDPSRSEIKADSVPLLFTSTPQQQTGTFEYELKNIGIHTGLRYEVPTAVVTHSIGLGVEVQKGLSKADLELPMSGSLYLFGNIYYRASYPLSRHIDLIVQPTFNYSFKVSDQLGAPFYVKPYGLGLSIGASFKLGNR